MFENVVVGATETEGAARALSRALEIARASGGTLHVVNAFPPRRRLRSATPGQSRSPERRRNRGEALLAEFHQKAAWQSVPVEMHPAVSDPVEAITRVAAETEADLIVVGSKGVDGTRHLSSVPRGVMDSAECAVLVV